MNIKDKVCQITNQMLKFLFCEFDDVKIEISQDNGSYYISFIVSSIDEELRTKIMQILKQGNCHFSARFENLELLEEIKDFVNNIRMETTDEETKISLTVNNE